MLNRGNKLKEDSMEGIWDEKPEKLLGVVVSASLPGIKEEIYTCQVTKKLAAKKKTKEWEKFISKESSWPQFFFAVPDSSNLELTITDKSGKVAGTYEIKVDDLKQDTVVAGEYELQVSDKKKKKAGESDDPQGKVDVRVYYSLLMETRPPGPGPHTYNYADYLGQIKTGDLVVYSGTGVLAAACQLITNTPYSHIGLAVYLPNRWTQEPELYIVELTKNFNRFQDAFKEVAESGINIFRFKERVHQYHGNSPVWWVPLKESLSPVHQQVLVEWIWKMHRGDQAVEDNIPPISVSKMTEFLTSRFKITVSYDVMLDFYSPAFVYKALGLAGALEEDMTKYSEGLFASDVVTLPCFGAPVQIRYKADDARVAGTQASSLAAGFAAASANKDGGRAKSGSMDGLPPVTGEPAARPRLGTAIGTPTKLGGSATSASPPGSQILPNPAAAAAAGGVAAPRRPQPAVPPRGAPPSIVHTATAGGMAGGVAAAAASVARNRPPSQTISSPLSAITQSHSPSNSSTGVMTKPGLGSAKTSLAAPPPLVAPSSLPVFAAAPVPAPLESREKRREKMMTLSRKFGTSRLAVTSLGIEGDFNSDEKAENAIDAIVAKMRGPGGIPMADINWQGKNYTKCFLGCDAVDWMLKCKVATTRDQAVELANEILVTGRLYHLSRRMAFIDGMEIYRFEIDDVEKTTSDKIPNVFQSSLENIMRRQRMATPDARVPKVMEVLIDAMMNLRATETEGIFRVPTSLTELEMLRKQFNSGDYACAAMRDAHLPACLLKLWLRDLSEALIPDYYYTNALYCDTLEDRQRLLKSLPEENQNVIVRLFELVYTLSKHSAVTKMDLNNLAMVFSPCFLRCPAMDPLVVMENLPREGMFVRGSFGDYCKARDALAASTAAAAAGEQENKEAADQEASSKVEA